MKLFFCILLCFAGVQAIAQVPVPPPATAAQVAAGTSTYSFISPATLAGASATVAQIQTFGFHPFAWYSAASFIGSTDSTPIAAIPDISGNGLSLAGNGFVYTNNGISGQPSFVVTGGLGMTNTGLFPASFTTNGAIWVVWQDFSPGNQNAVVYASCSNNVTTTFLFPYSELTGSQQNNGCVQEGVAGTTTDGGNVRVNSFNTTCVFENNGKWQMWINGYRQTSDPESGGGSGLSGDFYLGNLPGSGYQFHGMIAEVLITTNVLTVAQFHAVNQYFAAKYEPKQDSIWWLGDSEMKGWGASLFSNLLLQTSIQLKGWNLNMTAVGGVASINILGQMQTNMFPLNTTGGKKIALLGTGYNDASLAVCETNTLLIAQFLHSNNIPVAVEMCFSTCRETNPTYLSGVGGFSNYNAFILANSNQWDYIVRNDLNTNFGPWGSFSNNTAFYYFEAGFGGDLHLSGDSYRQRAALDVQAIQVLVQQGNPALGALAANSLSVSNVNSTVVGNLIGVNNGDVEMVLQNAAVNTNATTSYYAVADNGFPGLNGSNYVNIGINGSIYNQAVPFFGTTNDAYIFPVGNNDGSPNANGFKNLWIGTYNTNATVNFSVGNKGTAVNCGVSSNGFFGNGVLTVNSNAWNLVTATNGMANFAWRFNVLSNATPVNIWNSNGVAFVYYQYIGSGTILP